MNFPGSVAKRLMPTNVFHYARIIIKKIKKNIKIDFKRKQ